MLIYYIFMVDILRSNNSKWSMDNERRTRCVLYSNGRSLILFRNGEQGNPQLHHNHPIILIKIHIHVAGAIYNRREASQCEFCEWKKY